MEDHYGIDVVEVVGRNKAGANEVEAVLRWGDIESTFCKAGDGLIDEISRLSLSGSRVRPQYPSEIYRKIIARAMGILRGEMRRRKPDSRKRRRVSKTA